MGNVKHAFQELGFQPDEAENLKIRSDLMDELKLYIERERLSQKEAAQLFGVTQPRISNLVCGKIDLFSIDTLIAMIATAGMVVEVSVRDGSAPTKRPGHYAIRPSDAAPRGGSAAFLVAEEAHVYQASVPVSITLPRTSIVHSTHGDETYFRRA